MSNAVDHDLAISQQGHYAGAATRMAAYAIDQAVATGLYSLGVAVFAWILTLVTSGNLDPKPILGFASVGYLLWLTLYFGYPWAVSGKSFGMALLGLRVVAADGSKLLPKKAFLRIVSFPLGFLTLGIGFLGILFGKEHRAIYDRVAGSAVVYDWDARSARWRFLARHGNES